MLLSQTIDDRLHFSTTTHAPLNPLRSKPSPKSPGPPLGCWSRPTRSCAGQGARAARARAATPLRELLGLNGLTAHDALFITCRKTQRIWNEARPNPTIVLQGLNS